MISQTKKKKAAVTPLRSREEKQGWRAQTACLQKFGEAKSDQ